MRPAKLQIASSLGFRADAIRVLIVAARAGYLCRNPITTRLVAVNPRPSNVQTAVLAKVRGNRCVARQPARWKIRHRCPTAVTGLVQAEAPRARHPSLARSAEVVRQEGRHLVPKVPAPFEDREVMVLPRLFREGRLRSGGRRRGWRRWWWRWRWGRRRWRGWRGWRGWRRTGDLSVVDSVDGGKGGEGG